MNLQHLKDEFIETLEERKKYLFNKLYSTSEELAEDINEMLKQNAEKEDSLLIFSVMYKTLIKKHFDFTIRYCCNNPKCSYNEKPFLASNILKTCPQCKSGVDFINKDKLLNTLNFILKDYSFYTLDAEKETLYLIYEHSKQQYYLKKGNSSFQDFLYLRLKNNNDFVFNEIKKSNKETFEVTLNLNFLKLDYGNLKPNNLLFECIKENNLIKNIYDLGFKPVDELFYKNDLNTYFNKYKGNKYLNMILSDEEKQKYSKYNIEELCPNISLLLNNLVNNDEKGFSYLIKYLSFVLNNPTQRTEKVLSFYGEEETGKGIFYHSILDVLFEGYCSFILCEDLENSDFNEYYEDKLFVFIDESYYNKKIEQKMLSLTTAKSTTINKKFGSKSIRDIYFNYICASNKEIPMKVGNRRSVYFRSKTLGGNTLQAQEIGKNLANNIPNEINDFCKHLKSLNVSFSEINEGCDNENKTDIIEATKTIEERFLDKMLNYRSIIEFINDIKNFYAEELSIYLDSYIKDDFISILMFVDLYNTFRKKCGLKDDITLNRFSWFFNKLDIDRKDKSQYKRGYNNKGENVYWISKEIIDNKYKEGVTND